MAAKVKGQGHKVTFDENAQSTISVICHPNFVLLFSKNVFETWLVYRQYLLAGTCKLRNGKNEKKRKEKKKKRKQGEK